MICVCGVLRRRRPVRAEPWRQFYYCCVKLRTCLLYIFYDCKRSEMTRRKRLTRDAEIGAVRIYEQCLIIIRPPCHRRGSKTSNMMHACTRWLITDQYLKIFPFYIFIRISNICVDCIIISAVTTTLHQIPGRKSIIFCNRVLLKIKLIYNNIR